MSEIKIPNKLLNKLGKGELAIGIQAYKKHVEEVVKVNRLFFFPNFTDHGVEHLNAVLNTCVKLVPETTWRELTPQDAAILIGGVFLHDIGMHFSGAGFLALIADDSKFKPLPWFNTDQDEHIADKPWCELWCEFEREVKRLSGSSLARLIGTDLVSGGYKYEKLGNGVDWKESDRLIVGEFLRKHHARLAHEIAVYGFPGLGETEFPPIQNIGGLKNIDDLIGLTARSHWCSLTLCESYINAHNQYRGLNKPMESSVYYPMALLRISDYLQIQEERAPRVLLKLLSPKSRDSIKEWDKHQAIQYPEYQIPEATFKVIVKPDIEHHTYIALEELFGQIQREFEHTTAHLDRVYGSKTKALKLAINRIDYSQLKDLKKRLPYIAEDTRVTVDPGILSLLVKPLYGNFPSVGIRELVQNAIDAVRERHALEATHCQEDIVEITVELTLGDKPVLKITDNGTGMTKDTILSYFLRAGATYRNSLDWRRAFTDEDSNSQIARGGRFGVGVFAAFLLGDTFSVTTKHFETGDAFSFDVYAGQHSVVLNRAVKESPGTEITIQLPSIPLTRCWHQWFTSYLPLIEFTICSIDGRPIERHRSSKFNDPRHSTGWTRLESDSQLEIHWQYGVQRSLSHNGILVGKPASYFDEKWGNEYEIDGYKYHSRDNFFGYPNLFLVDKDNRVSLSVDRYSASTKSFESESELFEDVAISIIAHALVCGPVSVRESLLCEKHPSFWSAEKLDLSIGNWIFDENSYTIPLVSLLPSLGISSINTLGVIDRYSLSENELEGDVDKFELLAKVGFVTSAHLSLHSESFRDKREFSKGVVHVLERAGFPDFLFLSDSFSKMLSAKRRHVLDRSLYIEIVQGSIDASSDLKNSLLDSLLRIPSFISHINVPETTYIGSVSKRVVESWHELIGPKSIPFSLEERSVLIEQVKSIYPRFRFHATRWQAYKANGNSWEGI